MIKIIIETPFAGDREKNHKYLLACMRDSLFRGEAPFASHLIYTQMLDDTIPEERMLGMEAGFTWIDVADKTVVYQDLGISNGMQQGIERAKEKGKEVEYRSIM